MESEKIPKIATIIAFLRSNDWKLTNKTKLFYVLKAPESLGIQETFYYHIPLREDYRDYKKYITNLVSSMSELYEMDFDKLYDLLSSNIEELKTGRDLRQAILQNAA